MDQTNGFETHPIFARPEEERQLCSFMSNMQRRKSLHSSGHAPLSLQVSVVVVNGNTRGFLLGHLGVSLY